MRVYIVTNMDPPLSKEEGHVAKEQPRQYRRAEHRSPPLSGSSDCSDYRRRGPRPNDHPDRLDPTAMSLPVIYGRRLLSVSPANPAIRVSPPYPPQSVSSSARRRKPRIAVGKALREAWLSRSSWPRSMGNSLGTESVRHHLWCCVYHNPDFRLVRTFPHLIEQDSNEQTQILSG
jgi:hypothetical protein